MLAHLEKLVHKAKGTHQTWNRWAPPAEKRDFSRRLMELEIYLPKLVSGKATLIRAASIKEVTGREELKATALPRFTGSQTSTDGRKSGRLCRRKVNRQCPER